MSSKISELTSVYPVGMTAVGGSDLDKKTEEAQALFATLMNQMGEAVDVEQNALKDDATARENEASFAIGDSDNELQGSAYATDRIKKADSQENAVTEETNTQVQDAAEEVKNIICEEFSVTEEDLEKAMEQLGLTAIELLNPENFVQLIAELTGAEDTSNLLLSGEFLNVMRQTADITSQLAAQLGITTEELQQLLTKLAEGKEASFATELDVAIVDVQQEIMQADVEKVVVADTASDETVVPDSNESRVQTVNTVQEGADNLQEGLTTAKQEQSASDTGKNASENSAFEQNGMHTMHTGRAVSTDIQPQTAVYTNNVNVTEILSQIAEYVKTSVTAETTSLEMQLNPENLGKVYLHLSATKEGNVTAQFLAQSEMVKEALEMQLVDLRQTLNQQGIKVEAIEVTVSTHEFEKNLEQNAQSEKQQSEQQENQQGKRGLNRNELDGLSGLMTEEELLATKIMLDNGNSMDVTA